MQFNFNIAGIGAVSPAGQGLERLLDGTAARLQAWPTLSPSAAKVEAGCVDLTLPCWARWRAIPRLRRVGSQTLFFGRSRGRSHSPGKFASWCNDRFIGRVW